MNNKLWLKIQAALDPETQKRRDELSASIEATEPSMEKLRLFNELLKLTKMDEPNRIQTLYHRYKEYTSEDMPEGWQPPPEWSQPLPDVQRSQVDYSSIQPGANAIETVEEVPFVDADKEGDMLLGRLHGLDPASPEAKSIKRKLERLYGSNSSDMARVAALLALE